MLRACEPDPTKRFGSAEELGAALRALQAQSSHSPRLGSSASVEPEPVLPSVLLLAPSLSPADLAVTRGLQTRLAAEGHVVFCDEPSDLSVEWARLLEQRIRHAQVVIPILSATSIQSELMAYALEIARQSAQRPSLLPLLLPVLIKINSTALPRFFSHALENAVPVSTDGFHLEELIQHVLATWPEQRRQTNIAPHLKQLGQ